MPAVRNPSDPRIAHRSASRKTIAPSSPTIAASRDGFFLPGSIDQRARCLCGGVLDTFLPSCCVPIPPLPHLLTGPPDQPSMIPLHGALALCAAADASNRAGFASKPHIVVVLIDDMGYHNIHAPPLHVNAEIKSPFLASIASTGVTLSQYYACKPHTTSVHHRVFHIFVLQTSTVVQVAPVF